MSGVYFADFGTRDTSDFVINRLDLLTLQLFVSIVEERSIAKAAARENITSSAVSKRISDLEEVLGIALLVRHHKGVEPTEAGRSLLRHARAVLSDVMQLESDLRDHSQGTRGHVRVFANESTTLGCLPGDLSTFLEAHPFVEFEFQVQTSPVTVQAVTENAADIGIFTGDLPTGGLQVFPYHTDRLVVVLPSGHALARLKSVKFSTLLDYNLIGAELDSSIETLMFRAAGELGRAFRPRIRVTGFDGACHMVEAQLGIALVIAPFAAKMAKATNIVTIDLDEPWANRLHKLCVRDLETIPRAAQTLLRHLQQQYKDRLAAG
jgi:DNA-binding transcriptional LysR family regulator